MEKYDGYVLYDEDNCAIIPKDFNKYKTENIISINDKMKDIISLCLRVAKSDAPVLITGDSGVGKELLTELIHNNSNRKEESFIKINCASIVDGLKESEFFGYEAGSFTGASRFGKKGIIEQSQKGTLFLDEIGEMSLNLQSALLRVIQDGKFLRVGGYKEIKSDIRIICATNRDLKDLVEQGLFRNDLYFRLNVIPAFIPPLSERRDDIPILSLYYTDYFNKKYNTTKKLSRNVIEALVDKDWTGNVRELKNKIERLILITINGIITIEDLRYVESINQKEGSVYYVNQDMDYFETNRPLKEIMDEFEYNILTKAVKEHGSIRKAAKALSVNPSTISRKLKK